VRQEEQTKLWKQFKDGADPQAREELINHYAPLVKYVAGRIAINLPPSIEIDDLMSYGVFGLLDAIDRYEPKRGVKFETYAIARIRGAIIDGMRNFDWIPRSVRTKAKKLEQAYLALEQSLGRSPNDQELADYLQLSVDQFHQLLQEVSATTLASLDNLLVFNGHEDESLRLMDTIEDESSADPMTAVARWEAKELLGQAIDALSERERLVISLYYYEGLTLKEIGAVLGVSESRVCQVHSQAIFRLRNRLKRHREIAL
jgi:RNA polymerase sigma factor for flagellar operon FliA